MQNQQRNTLIFISLSFLIVVGSTFLQSWLWPPPPPQPVVKKLPADAWMGGDLAARWSAPLGNAPTLPGVAGAVQMVTDAHTAEWSITGRRLAVAARKAEKKPEAPPPPPPVAQKAAQPREVITLGGENHRLTVRLTSRGAGVKNLVCNHFDAADYYGLPTGSRLELLPEKLNEVVPSFVLYHYGAPEDAHPWDSLGTVDWAVEAKDLAPDAERQSVTFVTDVPGTSFRIRKTFTLAQGDYHLGLAVEIENRATTGDAAKLRYQLTGGHGLPIEGVWYTSTFRNALIGLTNPKDAEYRDFQDARSISHWDGGEMVGKRADLRLQYAGVVVQFFASVVAVDSRQEKRDFLAHARPTVNKLDRNPEKPHLDDIIMRLVSEPIELRPGEKQVHQYVLYNGPVKARLLGQLEGEKAVDPALVDG
jgi:YidC/Oxa1 family membrane protein insertase